MGSDTELEHQHRLVAQSIFQTQQGDRNASGETMSKEEESQHLHLQKSQ